MAKRKIVAQRWNSLVVSFAVKHANYVDAIGNCEVINDVAFKRKTSQPRH